MGSSSTLAACKKSRDQYFCDCVCLWKSWPIGYLTLGGQNLRPNSLICRKIARTCYRKFAITSPRKDSRYMLPLRLVILLCTFLLASPALAARCGGDFNTFVQSISAEAASAGISQGVISQALGGVQQDMGVLNFDRRARGTLK